MDLDRVRRGEIPNTNGKVFKAFGKIMPEIEYNYIAYKIAYLIASKVQNESSRRAAELMHTMQDFDLEPHKDTGLTMTISLSNDEILHAMAHAEFCNDPMQPADSPYRMQLKLAGAKQQ